MNVLEFTLTSPTAAINATASTGTFDPTTNLYSFTGSDSSGNEITFQFECADSPLTLNSVMTPVTASFVYNENFSSVQLTNEPTIKIGENEYVVKYEDCILPLNGTSATFWVRFEE